MGRAQYQYGRYRYGMSIWVCYMMWHSTTRTLQKRLIYEPDQAQILLNSTLLIDMVVV